jgi:DNA polymerase-1
MESLIVIRTLDELQKLTDYVADKDFIAFDTETTGLNKEDKIIGFSICADTEVGYYVVLYEWKRGELLPLPTLEKTHDFFKMLATKHLIMHNGVFDCGMVQNNFDVALISALHTDTLMLGHLLNENRSNGLKELGVSIFGEDAKHEQKLMLESIKANGGFTTKDSYELYKGDSELIARYGAKDAVLTLKLFYILVEDLYAQKLDKFFYEEETMPLLKGPTYDLNTTGLRVDMAKLQTLRQELEAQVVELKAFIQKETAALVAEKYPGTKKTNHFNIGSNEQLAWLLFEKLGNHFGVLNDTGKEICKALQLKMPYTAKDKLVFRQRVKAANGMPYVPECVNPKTGKVTKAKLIKDFWKYVKADKETLQEFEKKYTWVAKLLQLKKISKILDTYVIGIGGKLQYGIIRPGFLQHGTTSGRYSSRSPNFQNLPRDDKRVKACIVARPGKIFVGADYSQLEPRVFASLSQDQSLMDCFKSGDDFYATIGIKVFETYDAIPKKDGAPNAFGIKYKELRNISKVIALSATYGTTASKMAGAIGKTRDEAQEVIDNYFEKFPRVKQFMQNCHQKAKSEGQVTNLFGRPRRMPEAKLIDKVYGKKDHAALPYEARNILNLSVNHIVQSTSASIMNRAAILCWDLIKNLTDLEPLWQDVKIVLQVHDELVLEGPEALKTEMTMLLKHCMENATVLPGVKLEAEPKAAHNLGDLK